MLLLELINYLIKIKIKIDCSHVRMYGAPLVDDENLYVNRKGCHSINVQPVCDAGFCITKCVCQMQWPGTTRDCAVLHESLIRQVFTDGRLVKWGFPHHMPSQK